MVDFSQSAHRDMLRGVIDFVSEHPDWVLTYGYDLNTPSPLSPGEIDRQGHSSKVSWRRPEGVIGFIGVKHHEAIVRRRIRYAVSVSSVFDFERMGHVTVDNQRAGEMAAAHLIAQGFRRLAVFHRVDLAVWGIGFEERLEGVRAEAKRHGIAVDFKPNLTQPENWLKSLPKPIGVVATIDQNAVDVIRVATALGFNLPNDIAVVGMDNDDLLCNVVRPTLTSLDMNFRLIGYRAAAMLDSAMRRSRPPSQRIVIPPAALIPRGSSDTIISDQPLISEAMRYIVAHAHEAIGVTDIARELAVGLSTLEQHFRRWRRTTPLAELTRIRLDRAKGMLHSTDASVKRIARDCGFGDFRNLNRWFKRVFDKTATEYRQQLSGPRH